MAGRTVPLEKVEQAHIVNLIRSMGGTAYVLGTRRRRGDYQGTMQSPGIPDLWLVLPATETLAALGFWWEVKARKGRRSKEQERFARDCDITGTLYGHGTLDACIAFLVELGRIRTDQVGAHHLRRGA